MNGEHGQIWMKVDSLVDDIAALRAEVKGLRIDVKPVLDTNAYFDRTFHIFVRLGPIVIALGALVTILDKTGVLTVLVRM